MTITKKINWGYDAVAPGGVPDAAGDMYYSQDLMRDLLYLMDRIGYIFKDIKEIIPFLVSGGVVTQGAGATLNITAGYGYVKKSVQTVLSYGSSPPTTQNEDVEAIRVNWTAQTNMALPSYTPGGSVNYVKVAYTDADGSSRSRLKKAGSWYYDSSPSFTFSVDTTPPTSYELLLDTFTEGGGTFTFSGKKSSGAGGRYTVTSTPYQLNNGGEYIVNHTARVVFTLPPTASVGEIIKIEDIGVAGWQINQNAGQNILVYNQSTVPGTTGYIQSRTAYSSIELECVVADTTWIVRSLRDLWGMKGYMFGGDNGAINVATIEDMNFSYETSNAIYASLSAGMSQCTGVSAPLKGYAMGGYTGAASSAIQALTFATEVRSTLGATLDTARYSGAGVQSNSKGYMMGGYDTARSAVIEDLSFSAETSAAITATLDTAKYGNSNGAVSTLKGYVMGGYTTAAIAVIEDLIFSNETSQAITATLNTATYYHTVTNSNLKGYKMGGSPTLSSIEDLIFSNETSQAITAGLDTGRIVAAGVSSLYKGYAMGGDTGARSALIDGMAFVTEFNRVIAATLDATKAYATGVQGFN